MILLLIAAFSAPIHLAQAPAAPPQVAPFAPWRKFESRRGGFRAQFPGVPLEGRKTMRTDIGDVVATRHTLTDGNNVTYDILYNDFPKAGVAKVEPQKLLEGARDGLLYQTRGRLDADKRIMLGNLPGREGEIATRDGMRYRFRVLWAGNRLYQLLVITRGRPGPDAQRFFDSFQILRPR